MAYTIETVVGDSHMPLEAYRQALAAVTRADVWSARGVRPLVRFAEQLCRAYPAEAAREMVGLLSREELWSEGAPASDQPIELDETEFPDPHERWARQRQLADRKRQADDLELADAQDHVLEALASCGAGAQEVAIELLVGMRRAIEQQLVARVWEWTWTTGKSPIVAVDAALSRELEALPAFKRIEQPLIDLLAAMKRHVRSVGLAPWQEEHVPKEIDELTPHGRFDGYVHQALGATVFNHSVPGSWFVLGLVALAYRDQGSTVSVDGFWQSEFLICDGGLGWGKRFFFRTLAPSATGQLMQRVVRPEAFTNLLYSCRTIPGIAIPHILHVLRTSNMWARDYFLRSSEAFRSWYPRWASREAVESLVRAIEHLQAEVGAERLQVSDQRPVLFELAGAVYVLAAVAFEYAAEFRAHPLVDRSSLDEVDKQEAIARLEPIEAWLETIWPDRPLGANWEAVADAEPLYRNQPLPVSEGPSGWSPFSSVYRYTGVDQPAKVVRFAISRLGTTADQKVVNSTDWGTRINLKLIRWATL
jgi:hypothetical protein